MSYKIIGKYIKELDFKIPNPKIFSLLSKSISNYKINIDIKSNQLKERIIEVEIDLNEITGAETDDENSASDDEISFIPLDEQLKLHAKRADSYGEKIISLVS